MKPQHEILAAIGRALFGAKWLYPLANALEVNPRSLRYWAAGRQPIPPRVWVELQDLLTERQALIESALTNVYGVIFQHKEG